MKNSRTRFHIFALYRISEMLNQCHLIVLYCMFLHPHPPCPSRCNRLLHSQAGANAMPADPAAVQQLVGMGFSDAAVRRALAMTAGNVDAAANVLLEGR
jgi:hypothetical protein